MAGWLIGSAARLLGPSLFWSLHHKAFFALAGGADAPLDPGWEASVASAKRLYAELARSAGREPGILAVLSHPPVTDNVSPLNFVIMRRAYDAILAVRGRPTPVREVVAVDQMALDAAPWWQEGLYAGGMNRMHLAIDRQPSLRGPLQGRLLRESRPSRLPFRLASELSRGGDVAMILAGGVEATGRTLYTLREFLVRLRRAARRPPGDGPCPWRALELRLALALAGLEGAPPKGEAPVEAGVLPDAVKDAVREASGRAGVEPSALNPLLEAFESEFKRATPWRERFFSFLFRRAAARRPVLLIPVSHGPSERPVIRLGRSAGLAPRSGAGVEVLMVEDGPLTAEAVEPSAFARSWVTANFD